jgi:excisionase family DNA binding protein
MDLSNLINENALITCVNNEVERLFKIKVEEIKKELSENYFFDDRFLTREQVAEKLEISIGTVDNIRKKGKLNGFRVGTLVRFKNSEVLAYMKNVKPC